MDSGFDMLGQFKGHQALPMQQGLGANPGLGHIQGTGTNKLRIGLWMVKYEKYKEENFYTSIIEDKEDFENMM